MKCEIIRDLLPVYCDGLASEETAEEVEKHIAECSECRGIYENMKAAVPELPKPDIQPMKKVRKALRLRLWLSIGIIAAAVLTAGYQLFCAHPMLARTESIIVEHTSRMKDGGMEYIYKSPLIKPGQGRMCSVSIPKGSVVEIDKEHDCVWVDGEKLSVGYSNDKEIYAPADGVLEPSGILCVDVKCKTGFKAVRFEYEHYPELNPLLPSEAKLELRPCLPFRQDMNQCLGDSKAMNLEFSASQCGKGARLTINCRDGDIMIDLHELAIAEGIIDE